MLEGKRGRVKVEAKRDVRGGRTLVWNQSCPLNITILVVFGDNRLFPYSSNVQIGCSA